jgi:hypothetical protein
MSQTAIQQTSPEPRPEKPTPGPQARTRTLWGKVQYVLTPIASLRLTVVLFALSLFLVFVGTMAQVEMGINTAMETYFRSAFVWVPFQLFVKFGQVFLGLDSELKVGGGFPFFGGWLLGGVLLMNLLAAHLVRFKVSWKRSGILLIHSGLVVMMLSELITGLFAVESHMTLTLGESANFIEEHSSYELAVIDRSNAGADKVVVVPDSLLKKGGRISNDQLPVDLQVLGHWKHSVPVDADTPNVEGPVFTSSAGESLKFQPGKESSGVNSQMDFPMVRVRFLKKGTDEALRDSTTKRDDYLLTTYFDRNMARRSEALRFAPQYLRAGAKTYVVEFRPRRIYKPYSVQLLKFEHRPAAQVRARHVHR